MIGMTPLHWLLLSGLIGFVLFFLVIGIVIKIYCKLTAGRCPPGKPDQLKGKTVIITGANGGIGRETARELAKRGARVIMACHNLTTGREVAKEIMQETGNQQISVRKCDLSSMKSVRAFCQDILNTEDRLDVLLMNAGMVPPPGRYLTEDFLEVQFATNHLGHFLLANLLMDLMKRSAPARIIAVSSLLHRCCRSIDFNNLAFEKRTVDPFFRYCESKLANILFCKEFTRRYTSDTQITANSLHPGLVRTKINRRTPWYLKNFIQPIAYLWAKTPEEGAQTSIYLAVAPELDQVSGKYFVDCKEANCSSLCDDEKLAARLWTVSEQLTGLKSPV